MMQANIRGYLTRKKNGLPKIQIPSVLSMQLPYTRVFSGIDRNIEKRHSSDGLAQ